MSTNNFNAPFRISGDTDGWCATHDGIGCSECQAIKDADDFVVALVVDQSEDHRAQLDTKKHADLFAAAPDLLQALIHCATDEGPEQEWLNKARAAIAKATGAAA